MKPYTSRQDRQRRLVAASIRPTLLLRELNVWAVRPTNHVVVGCFFGDPRPREKKQHVLKLPLFVQGLGSGLGFLDFGTYDLVFRIEVLGLDLWVKRLGSIMVRDSLPGKAAECCHRARCRAGAKESKRQHQSDLADTFFANLQGLRAIE